MGVGRCKIEWRQHDGDWVSFSRRRGQHSAHNIDLPCARAGLQVVGGGGGAEAAAAAAEAAAAEAAEAAVETG